MLSTSTGNGFLKRHLCAAKSKSPSKWAAWKAEAANWQPQTRFIQPNAVFFWLLLLFKKTKNKNKNKNPKTGPAFKKKQEIPHKNQTCNSLENKTIGCCIPGLRQLSGGHLSQGSEPKIPKVAGLNSLLIP